MSGFDCVLLSYTRVSINIHKCVYDCKCILMRLYCLNFCSKKLLSSAHQFIHLNLATVLLLSFFVFMVGIETAAKNRVSI